MCISDVLRDMYYRPDTGGCGCESASIGIRVIKGGYCINKKGNRMAKSLNTFRNTC